MSAAGLCYAEGPALVPWPAEMAGHYRAIGLWTGQCLDSLIHKRGEAAARTALVCGRRRWSYAELDTRVARCAAGLQAMGVGAGDRVIVQLPNLAEYVVAVFALLRLGALPVFALPAHRRSEIAYFCAQAEAVAYLVADRHAGFDYRTLAREVKAEVPTLRHVIVVGAAQEFIAFDSLDGDFTPVAVDPAALAFLQLSGGSTGRPKLIPRTHDDYLYSVRESARICALAPTSVYLCVLPAAHNFPMSSPGILGAFHAGGTVVMAPDARPETCLPLIEREGVTVTALVPPLVPLWLDAIARRPASVASLMLLQVGGARFDSAVARRVIDTTSIRLQQVFGMAEGLVNYTRLDDPPDVVAHTQGRPISPLDEIRIVDDEDRLVPEGEVGHLLTRGPYTIRGYFRAAEHNARAFTPDGFYRTGDLVRRTPEGNLVVEGRAKDQVNRGGEKISAEEVEHHLLAHAGVVDCAIVAMPDVALGEKSCAFVIPASARLRAVELNRFLRDSGLAAYKIPDRIEFVSVLPKTAVGKISKKRLREYIATRLAAST